MDFLRGGGDVMSEEVEGGGGFLEVDSSSGEEDWESVSVSESGEESEGWSLSGSCSMRLRFCWVGCWAIVSS